MCGGSGGTSGSVLTSSTHRPVGGERLVPGRAEPVGIVDIDALEADQLGELVIGHVRDAAATPRTSGSPSITRCSQVTWFRSSLLNTQHDPARVRPVAPVFGDGDQLGHVVHLHGAVADQRDHRPVGMRELGGDRVGHRRAHRGEPARQRAHHAAPDLQVARIPVGAGAGIAGDDRALRQARRQLPGRRAAD